MLDYRKVTESNGIAEYEFYIEGNNAEIGHVSFDKTSGAGYLIDENPTFRQKRYGAKLLNSLEQQNANEHTEDIGTEMWY